MAVLGGLLLMGVGIGMLICWIMVLIKLFQNEGPLWGILGIICGLYALIWGWMNADKYNLRKIVTIWTVLFVAYIVLYILVGGAMMSRMAVPS